MKRAGPTRLLEEIRSKLDEFRPTPPLTAPVRPQKHDSRNGNGSRIRPDGFAPVTPHRTAPAKPKKAKPPIPDRQCKRAACGKWFTPKRPNQQYCPGDCRQRAHDERLRAEYAAAQSRAQNGDAVNALASVLEELAAAPEQLRRFAAGHRDPMYSRIVQLADRAAAALESFRSRK